MPENQTALINEKEFVERFVAKMLLVAGPVDADGDSVEDYARQIARSYFEEQYLNDDMSPEECASTDVSYWEE